MNVLELLKKIDREYCLGADIDREVKHCIKTLEGLEEWLNKRIKGASTRFSFNAYLDVQNRIFNNIEG